MQSTAAGSQSSSAIEAIAAAIGADYIRAATAVDAIDGTAARWIIEPASAQQVSAVLKICDEKGLRVVARGGGTKIDWGNPPRGLDVVLSTHRLDQVLEHAAGDMTATVQAGCTVEKVQNVLAAGGDSSVDKRQPNQSDNPHPNPPPEYQGREKERRHAQFLAIDPLWPRHATIGGIIATNDSGGLRAAYGTLRDHLIGITIVLADGTIARSGGKVVKNVAGYDLPKLFIGSFGTLGVITEATFRLYSAPHASRTLRFAAADEKALGRLIAMAMELSQVTLAVQFEAAEAGPIAVSARVGALEGAIEAKVRRITQAATDCGAIAAEADEAAWSAREKLFEANDACIAQISALPTRWPQLIERLRAGQFAGGWQIVAQAAGVGTIRIAAAQIEALRREVASAGGTLVILRCPAAVKSHIDVWPSAGDALPLMRQVKRQFDPRGTLSPGRFIGGI